MKQLLNLDFLDPQRILIPTSTGECPSNVEILYTAEELKKYDPELYSEMLYDCIQAVYTTTVEKAPQVFESLFYKLIRMLHSNYIADVEFLLEIPSGLPYSAKEFLKIQFEIWAKKELFADLYEFSIYSKYSEDITKIKFKVNLWD